MSFCQGASNGMNKININCVLCSFSMNQNEKEIGRTIGLVIKLSQFTNQLNIIVFSPSFEAYTQYNWPAHKSADFAHGFMNILNRSHRYWMLWEPFFSALKAFNSWVTWDPSPSFK